jgi:hypothetical protein
MRTTVPLDLLSDDGTLLSTQMLKPKVVLDTCAWSLPFGIQSYDEAVTRLLATVPDANVLRNATVETRGLHLGLALRTCLTIRGDAVRRISEVVLPDLSGAHGGHR